MPSCLPPTRRMPRWPRPRRWRWCRRASWSRRASRLRILRAAGEHQAAPRPCRPRRSRAAVAAASYPGAVTGLHARQFVSTPALAARPAFPDHTFEPPAAPSPRGTARNPGACRECRAPDRMRRRRDAAGLPRQSREARPRTRQTARRAAARLGRQRRFNLRVVAVADLVRARLRSRAPQPARSRRHASPQSRAVPFLPAAGSGGCGAHARAAVRRACRWCSRVSRWAAISCCASPRTARRVICPSSG